MEKDNAIAQVNHQLMMGGVMALMNTLDPKGTLGISAATLLDMYSKSQN